MIRVNDREYQDIDEALRNAERGSVIDLDNQVIRKQLTIDKSDITIKNGAFDYNLSAHEILSDGYKRGTFRTYSVFVDADNVCFENIVVRNSSGYENGQAIALMIAGDNFRAKDCVISSYQDTLFIGPLPDREYEERGFVGPLEGRERKFIYTFFDNCRIEGSIDFIFGGGFGYFHKCEIRSLDTGKEINGYVCAPSTSENKEYGFIFDECEFTSEDNMDNTVYLGRPWRDYGKCLIVDSVIGKHIKAEGYSDWNKENAQMSSQFKEHNNINLTESDRVKWMKETNNKDLEYINLLRGGNV